MHGDHFDGRRSVAPYPLNRHSAVLRRPSARVASAALKILATLNAEQRRAVTTTEGPVLILAGAGSGKTRVITYRVAHLIENREVRPEQILAVTFTNKAADQMKYRVRNLLRAARSGDPLISTFHSFCVRLLRRETAGSPQPGSWLAALDDVFRHGHGHQPFVSARLIVLDRVDSMPR